MSGEEANNAPIVFNARLVKQEVEDEYEQEQVPAEEIYQGSPSSSFSSHSGASSKDLQAQDDISSEHALPSSEQQSGNVPENSAPAPSTQVCTNNVDMETYHSVSALNETRRSFPNIAVEVPSRSINLEELDFIFPSPSFNSPAPAHPPLTRNVYASEPGPSQSSGIGAFLQLESPSHLAYDLYHLPRGSLAPGGGSPDINVSTTPAASNNFNIQGSSDLFGLPNTIPSLPGAAYVPASFQYHQLPQVSRSSNHMPQVSIGSITGMPRVPPGFEVPLTSPAYRPYRWTREMELQLSPSIFSYPAKGGEGSLFQQFPNSTMFQHGMGASPYNNIGSSSIAPQLDGHRTNTGRLEAAQGNFMNGRQLEAGESSSRPSKVQVVSWPNTVQPSSSLQLSSWNINPAPAPPNERHNRFMMNSVYDPRYEAMGLPIDPHLRMLFLQNMEKNGGAGGTGGNTGNGNNNP